MELLRLKKNGDIAFRGRVVAIAVLMLVAVVAWCVTLELKFIVALVTLAAAAIAEWRKHNPVLILVVGFVAAIMIGAC
jgi:hypothetical protein